MSQSHAHPAHPALGALQLLALLAQLLDDVGADLVGLGRDALRALDALAGSAQAVRALQQQHPLGLQVGLKNSGCFTIKHKGSSTRLVTLKSYGVTP